MKKSVSVCLAWGLVLLVSHSMAQAGPASGVGASLPPLLELEAAVARAMDGNPGLAAIRSRAEALALIPIQQGTLPDPRLSLNVLNVPVDTFSLSQEGMTQVQIGLAQELPFPGKLALREAVASARAEMGEAEVGELRLTLVRDVRTAWWQIFAIDRALETLEANKRVMRQFVDIAQSKYRVGRGLQQDVLLAQLELSRFFDRELDLEAVRRSLMSRLNALMAAPAGTLWRLPTRVDDKLPPVPDSDRLRQAALKNRPIVRRHRAMIDMTESGVALAEKDNYPDFKLGAAYGLRSGRNPDGGGRADFLSLRLSMNLPIYDRRRQGPQLDQRRRERIEAGFRLRDIEDRVADEVERALADYARSREQVSLFSRGIIPQAVQTVASMRAGYQVNKVDFLNLMRAQITLFNYQTRYWRTLSEARQALARLAAATGKELEHE